MRSIDRKRNSPSLSARAGGPQFRRWPRVPQHLPQRWIGRTTAEHQALLRWPPRSPDLKLRDVYSWGYVRMSFYPFYHRICLSCEDEQSLPSHKSNVTCCSGYWRKWIIELTSVVSQGADTQRSHEVCNNKLVEKVSLSICRSHVQPCPPFKCINLIKCAREEWIASYRKLVKRSICSISLYGTEAWTFLKVDQIFEGCLTAHLPHEIK